MKKFIYILLLLAVLLGLSYMMKKNETVVATASEETEVVADVNAPAEVVAGEEVVVVSQEPVAEEVAEDVEAEAVEVVQAQLGESAGVVGASLLVNQK